MDIDVISLIVGVVGTAIAIYQAAVIRERRIRDKKLQYLLAAIHKTAATKQAAWNQQLKLYGNNPSNNALIKLCVKGRDEFLELSTMAKALEGVIDPDFSASQKLSDQLNENYKRMLQEPKLSDS